MSAVPVRFARVLRQAATKPTAAFVIALTIAASGIASVQAAPLAAALGRLSALTPQIDIAQPTLLPAPLGLRRHARWRHEIVRRRHARAGRLVRIRSARVEFARMSRRGQGFCLATAIYFEARDEPARGQRAVAAVILARAHTPGRPKTICGVVFEGSWRKTGCQFSFACDGRPDVAHWRSRWLRAQRVAASVMHHQGRTRWLVRGATFYHTKYVHPRWDKRMVRVARIGAHIFYRPRQGHLS